MFLNSSFYLEREKELISIEYRGGLDPYLRIADSRGIAI